MFTLFILDENGNWKKFTTYSADEMSVIDLLSDTQNICDWYVRPDDEKAERLLKKHGIL